MLLVLVVIGVLLGGVGDFFWLLVVVLVCVVVKGWLIGECFMELVYVLVLWCCLLLVWLLLMVLVVGVVLYLVWMNN